MSRGLRPLQIASASMPHRMLLSVASERSQALSELLVGARVLQRYRVVRQLGRGGMGLVRWQHAES